MDLHPRRINRPRYQRILDSLRETEPVKVLQGVRRCGKSTMLAAFRDRLLADGVAPQNIFYRRFDEFGLPLEQSAENLMSDLQTAFKAANPTVTMYVFLDEIQEVEGWERVVRRLHTRPGTDVYITGSNAHILSSDLATLLSGRQASVMVHPLSFEEYLAFRKAFDMDGSEEAAFADYLRFGGMPSLFTLRDRSIESISRELSSIMDTVVLNDVARRLKLRDVALLQRLITYLFATAGNLFSTNKVVGALASARRKTSSETIDNYIDALEKAYVISETSQTGLQGKQLLAPQRKIYPVDQGLRNLVTHFSAEDTGFQLENVVHNELTRRGYTVEVGTLRVGEVDFVARRNDEVFYVQVCATMLDPATRERELKPLRAITDAFPRRVITLDRFGLGTTEDGIQVVNAIDWLLRSSE
ncbi:AAA+ family ATPase [Olsenella sp. An285]|uniref:ATP-binding protein n=1 Tax=Olsenella sp. An285 TaxID=1965621 RepID=UPI000B380F16|nr:ATP-binding protein [Olsenella sp. An285]OUO48549.1 AAA+ family ATPase [Olsenella sp. An285]